MKVLRLGFLGTRTEHVEAMRDFLRDVLGLEAGHTQDDWAVSRLPGGRFDLVEVFGSDFPDERFYPREAGPLMVAFFVDDLVSARAELEQAGVELIGGLVWADELFDDPALAGLGWCFFRAPDGNVYTLEQAP